MKEKDIDFLILQYLKKKGYSHAEQVFRVQSNLDQAVAEELTGKQGQSHSLDTDAGLQDLLFCVAAEANPQAYVDSFDQLAAWADSSLDLYRMELQRVLYPVFVHVYLQLVQYGASHVAADLLKQYRRRLVEVGGRQSSIRAQELNELQAVAVAQHLDAHPFAKAARSSRSTLLLSAYSFELLMHYLQGRKQWLLLSILNSHVRFELHEGLPLLDAAAACPSCNFCLHEGLPLLDAAAAGDDEGAGLLQGQAGHDVGAINTTPLDLGLLRDGTEDAYATQKLQEEEERLAKQTAGASAAAAAAAAEDGFTEAFGNDMLEDGGALSAAAQQASAAAKRLKAVRDKALAAAKAKQKEILESRRMPMIPLLPAHEKLKKSQRDDLEARVQLHPPDNLPSAAFFSILNSQQTLTSMTVSPDTKLVAAGFSDSSLRLYHLALLGKQRGKLGERAEKRAAGLLPQAGAKRARGAAHRGETGDGMDVDAEEEELLEELEDLSNQQTMCLVGHSGTVNALSFSVDQQLLFSASSDSTVRLWSTELRKGLAAYRGHVYPVWDVAACPHGSYLVSGGSDRTARLWSTEHARPLRIYAGHQSDVDTVAWHPNSQYIATGSSDRTVRLWDVGTGACVRLMSAQSGCPTCLAFSPDGRQLAAGTEDGSVSVYDLGSARRMALLECHTGPVWSAAYSRGGGSLLATGGADRTLRLFSMPACDNILDAINQELAAAAAGDPAGADAAAGGVATAAATKRAWTSYQLPVCSDCSEIGLSCWRQLDLVQSLQKRLGIS
ncbi:hypothetical protein OEZ86_008196 [Tetradesmus obliquus]|nr:hypothetical protein OEZ86_008196 [Tetradesmus obliquus]